MRSPKLALQTLIQNNPQYKQFEGIFEKAEKYVADNGGDEREAFMKLAQECGVDGNEIINMIQTMF